MSRSQVLYRALLTAYPRTFRARYGEMVLADFGLLHNATWRRDGLTGLARLWSRTIPRVLRDGLEERRLLPEPLPSGGAPRPQRRSRRRWFADTVQDIRYAVRNLMRSPGFAAVAIITIAVGMAANATIFGMTHALMFAELPFGEGDRLAMIWTTRPDVGVSVGATSAADWVDLRERSESFEDIAISHSWAVNLNGDQEPLALTGYTVTTNTFGVLLSAPVLGRGFGSADGEVGAPDVVVLSWRLWQRLGADPEIVGTAMLLNEREHTVVGVMPEGFEYPQLVARGDLWRPARWATEEIVNARSERNKIVIGRLADGTDIDTASAELAGIMAQLEEDYPGTNEGVSARAVLLREQMSEIMAPALAVLLVTVGFVLLICCANVANLLLARGATRQGEIAIRKSLGASRARIVRQLLVECVIVSLAGVVVGHIAASFSGRLLVASLPEAVLETSSAATQAGPDMRVLLVTFLVAATSGIVFGLVPAFRAARADLGTVMRASGESGHIEGGRGRLRSLLLVAEVAVSVVLLIGSGLMVKGFTGLVAKDPGFEAADVLTIEVAPNGPRYEGVESRQNFYREAIREIESVRGVDGVGATSILPLSFSNPVSDLQVEGVEDLERTPSAGYRAVTAGYLPAMGATVVGGRLFEDADRADSARVAVVNEALLRHLREGDAIGQRIRGGDDEDWITIVGVIRNFQHLTMLDPPGPAFFVPYEQTDARARMLLAIKSDGRPAAEMATEVRDAVWRVDAAIPVDSVRTLEKIVRDSLVIVWLPTSLMAAFGAAALGLAAVGLYGLLAYRVARRTREFGVRVALGAAPRQVLALAVRRGMALTAIGATIGLAVAIPIGRLLAAVLEGVNAGEPLVYLGVPTLLLLVALVATVIPARRALALDPAVSLRSE